MKYAKQPTGVVVYNSLLNDGRKLMTITGPVNDVKQFAVEMGRVHPLYRVKSETFQYDLGRATVELYIHD
jgi:hypothetical protein